MATENLRLELTSPVKLWDSRAVEGKATHELARPLTEPLALEVLIEDDASSCSDNERLLSSLSVC